VNLTCTFVVVVEAAVLILVAECVAVAWFARHVWLRAAINTRRQIIRRICTYIMDPLHCTNYWRTLQCTRDFTHSVTPTFRPCRVSNAQSSLSSSQTAMFMFKFKLPSIFNSYFTHTSSIHHYATRGSISDFAMPSIRTKIRQKSIKYQGPFVWNKLPFLYADFPPMSSNALINKRQLTTVTITTVTIRLNYA